VSDQLFTAPLVQTIGWALVHFIWQGALIAGIAAALLGALRGGRSATRYGIACAALALMLAAPIATMFHLSSASWPDDVSLPPAQYRAVAIGNATGAIGEGLNGVTPVPGRIDVEAAVGVAVFAWLAGVLLLSLRLLTGWIGVERLRRQARPLSDSLEAQVAVFCARLRITRSVRVLESAAIAVPTLVGWIRPVILMPVGVIVGMPPAHLDAVLAHELAHVRRHDYAVNVLQAIVETLWFYHPAVWWCSRQVRIEREHCCDDLAVDVFGDRLEYATALTNLEERRRNDVRLALAANDGQLLDRVRRLLGVRPAHDGRTTVWLLTVVAAVTVALAAAGSTMAGAESRQDNAQEDVILPAERSDLRNALIHLTARIAAWRGYLFSPQILPFPPAPPRAPEPPAPPEPPSPPEPPAPSARPALLEPLALPAPPAPIAPPEPPEPSEPPAPPAPPAPLERIEPPAAPEPPRAPTPLAPPAPPAPPAQAAPAPPAPPAPLAITSGQGRNRVTWGNRGEQMTLEYSGSITLADDDRDIASMAPGAYFQLSEERSRIPLLDAVMGAAREIELRGRSDGTIERRYSVNRREQAFEPEGRQWLRDVLPVLVRRTGFAAEQRVTRILRRDGADGVAREIGLLESDFVRSLYVRLLSKQARLSTSELNDVLQAMQIGSDFEMAQALIALAETQTLDASGPSFFRAARTIDSDFERRRALSPLLARPRDAAFSREMFATAEDIDSDFELATFLRAAAAAGLVDQGRDAFFGAAATIGSDFERRRALTAVVQRPNVPVETLEAVVRSASDIGSDFEQAELLLEIARRHRVEGRLRERLLDLVESSIGSEHERGRVLAAVLRSERAAR
jgi:beta-lactamase regulating signal transducer with metallopeptidase domain